jgi:hypothetical protein
MSHGPSHVTESESPAGRRVAAAPLRDGGRAWRARGRLARPGLCPARPGPGEAPVPRAACAGRDMTRPGIIMIIIMIAGRVTAWHWQCQHPRPSR